MSESFCTPPPRTSVGQSLKRKNHEGGGATYPVMVCAEESVNHEGGHGFHRGGMLH